MPQGVAEKDTVPVAHTVSVPVPEGESVPEGVYVGDWDTVAVGAGLTLALAVPPAALALGVALSVRSCSRRSALFSVSATAMLPPLLASAATAAGPKKRAAVPWPFTHPGADAPPPASVSTAPLAVATRRMAWLPLSAMYRAAPLASRESPCGSLKRAAVPAPSAKPALPAPPPPPASVLVAPLPTATARRALFPVSATYRMPALASSARPPGARKRATAAAPSTRAAPPPTAPASVPTPPPAVYTRMTCAPASQM